MKLAVFYHVYPGKDWEDMFQSQIGALVVSNLLNAIDHLHIGFNGDLNLMPTFFGGENLDIVVKENDNKTEETDTLRALYDYCRENPGAYVLYMHTKGASRKNTYTEDWRYLMEYFCIHQWQKAIKALDKGHETAGANYQRDTSMGYHPHYSGGFWWAKASYVATCLDLKYLDHPLRFMREFFIGSGKPNEKNFWESNLNKKDIAMHYVQPYSKKIYSRNYLTDTELMNAPVWESPDKGIVKILDDLDVNGFESEGGTDKNTLHNFTGIYAYLLDQYRDTKGRLLEIGVQHGGSSLCWHEYLNKFHLDLVDIQDIVPDKIWHNMDQERYEFYQADAYTKSALEVFSEFKYDVIIDDGPHSLHTQQFSVANYFNLLKPGGVLIIEDIQNVHHLTLLTETLNEEDRKGVRIFDVRETKGRYDDLIWAVIKE